MLQEIVIAIALALFIYTTLSYLTRPKGMPPGPLPLPILGNLPTLMSFGDAALKRTQVVLTSLAEKYGDIFTLELPGRRVVVVNTIALAREALLTKKDDFAGRPKTFVFGVISMGFKDIALGDFSSTLVLQRKIVHSAIRMYQPLLEEKIVFEVNEMFKRVPAGRPFNPKHDVIFVVLNVIYQMTVSDRFDDVDDKFKKSADITRKLASLISPMNFLNFLPFLYHFPISTSQDLREVSDYLHQYFILRLKEHKETYQEGVIRDLADALIKARQEAAKEDSRTYHLIDEEHIVMTMVDVYIAGFETSSTALLWIILYLVKNPEIQAKIHQEMDSALGQETRPSWKHRTELPFLVATIDETLRKASITPLLVPHKATKDSTLGGFQIPKGTELLFNSFAMHESTREWSKPDEFNPSRFLDSRGKVDQVAGAKSFLPFGMGRRVCVGEALAKQEIFVVASNLLYQFTVHLAETDTAPEITDDVVGVAHYPPQYEIYLKPRSK